MSTKIIDKCYNLYPLLYNGSGLDYKKILKILDDQKDTDVSKIGNHIKLRFDELKYYLDNNPKLKVIIAGANKDEYNLKKKNRLITKDNYKDVKPNIHDDYFGSHGHRLGTGLAKGQWGNDEKWWKIIQIINQEVENLVKKYSSKISFEYIGNGYSKDVFHVWGANAQNWNFPQDYKPGPFGSGQASYIKEQVKGVFGIVTTPSGGTKPEDLFTPDRTNHF